MPKFSYVASSAQGENVRGALDAVDKGDLAKKLRDKNLFLVSFRVDESAGAVASPRAPEGLPMGLMLQRKNPTPAPAPQKTSFLDQIKNKLEKKPETISSKGNVPLK